MIKLSDKLAAGTSDFESAKSAMKSNLQVKLERAITHTLSGAKLLRNGEDIMCFVVEKPLYDHLELFTNDPDAVVVDLLNEILESVSDDMVTGTSTCKNMAVAVTVSVVQKK